MDIKEITATFGAKINLGDFNSVHVEITLNADVEATEDTDLSIATLLNVARDHVRAAAKEFKSKNAPRIQEVFAGKPMEG